MKMFRKDEGFTLVELMVVVLIIGILVAIAIPVFNAAKANAQRKSCFANQRTIEGSAQTYNAENDALPTTRRPIWSRPSSRLRRSAPRVAGWRYAIDASGTVTGDSGASAGWSTVDGPVHTHF